MTQLFSKHIDGQNVAELRRWNLEHVAGAKSGADLRAGMLPYYNTVSGNIEYSLDGTTVLTLASVNDVTAINSFRGVVDASGGAIPTAAGSTVRPGDVIKAGDFWRVSVAGTLVGIQGLDDLEENDVVYALADGASTAAQFFAVQGNAATSGGGTQKASIVALAALPANTATDVVPIAGDNITSITNYMIFNAAGQNVTNSFDDVLDNATPKITLTSLVAASNLTIQFVGS